MAQAQLPRWQPKTKWVNSPTPEQVRQARIMIQLTQAQAAEMVIASRRTWQSWELGERTMPPAIWELFQIKADMILAARRLRARTQP